VNAQLSRPILGHALRSIGLLPFLLPLCLFLSPLVGCGGDEPTQVTDGIPPVTIQDLTYARLSGSVVRLTWTAPGDDGSRGIATTYSVRCAASTLTEQAWDSAAVIPSPPVPAPAGHRDGFIVTMPNGRWHIGVRTADEIPNWSMISNQITVLVGDSVPPAKVTDLSVTQTTGHSASLAWTAPGDDDLKGHASAYDLRYSRDVITSESWESATRALGLSPPADHGTYERHVVDGLETGATYYFAMKCADEVPNWSAISNVASTEVIDIVSPSAITNLLAGSAGETSVNLTWTAPGNDGADGTAAAYDMRYSLDALNAENWENATAADGLPAPRPSGAPEAFVLDGLQGSRTYYIGIRSRDEGSNWSAISNIVTAAPGTNPLVRLTYSTVRPYGADYPAWSPDGRTIAFSAYWEPRQDYLRAQIYTMPAAGGEPVQMTQIDDGAYAPAWSPDGTKFAFIALREVYPNTLQELSVMTTSPGSQHAVLLTAPAGYTLSRPCWSPDGSQIAVVVSAGYSSGDPMSSNLGLVPSGGGAGSELLVGWFLITAPSWSPDGTKILFNGRREDGDRSVIWVMPAGGGEPTPLTTGQADDASPAWSPDGGRIAFASSRTSTWDLWIMSSEGANLTRLTFDSSGHEYYPSWSPDSRAIVFTMWRLDIPDIWVMSLR
jgi:Tol biopolymer transport system component/predicted Fe-S protein YdhL (DUF1289 family)